MYSNNTTQPTSTSPYMWDLTGLKLEDFYTYGMNNNVKPSDDSYVTIIEPNFTYIERGIYWYHDFCGGFGSGNQRRLPPILFRDVEGIEISANDGTTITVQIHKEDKSPSNVQGGGRYQGSLVTESAYSSTNTWGISGNKWVCISFECLETTEYIDIDIGIEKYRYYITDICRNSTTGINTEVMKTHCIDINDISSHVMYYGNPTSITMPQRMPGYSVRLVNADITPNEYPTMLYPKWIDVTLPITGKLDYTKYNGTSLAWAYAYTTGDVTIDPVDSRNIGQITHDYNKLYGTDFVDVVDVWVYKDTDVSKLSTNEVITEAYIELTSDNYKTRVSEALTYYPNCTDVYLFEDGSVTSLQDMFNTNNTIYRNQIVNVTFMDGYFDLLTNLKNGFREMKTLKRVNNIPNSVTNMAACFLSAYELEYVSNLPSNLETGDNIFTNCFIMTSFPSFPNNGRIKNLNNAFQSCSALTAPPTIPDSVTNMKATFYDCSSLTQAPTIPSNVTSLENTFYGCLALTTAPNIPNSVTNMSATFYGCTSLTTVPNIGSSVTSLASTFYGCTSLTTAPNIPSSCYNMGSTFQNCTSLTTPPNIPSSVTNMSNTFYGCISMTTAPVIPDNVESIYYMDRNCKYTEITIPISKLTSWKYIGMGVPLTNVDWKGERSTDFTLEEFYIGFTQRDIQELVPEHLADLTELGTTATLTLGETYLAYLTEDEIAQAVAKGWTLQ